jgi:hypothetical protein
MWSRAQCSGNGAHCSHFCARIAPICARIAPARARALLPHVRAHCSRTCERIAPALLLAPAPRPRRASRARRAAHAPARPCLSTAQAKSGARLRSNEAVAALRAAARMDDRYVALFGGAPGRATTDAFIRARVRGGGTLARALSGAGSGARLKAHVYTPSAFAYRFPRPRLVSREAPVPPLSSSLPSSSRWSLRRHRRAAAAARAGHPGYAEVVVIATAVRRCRNRPPLSRHRPL